MPTCLWTKAAAFLALRDGLTISQVVACRCIRMFFYARAFGIHHLRMGRLARPSSKGCSKHMERAVREKLSSHSPNLSTSVPAHGAVACDLRVVGAGRGLARAPPLVFLAHFSSANVQRDLGNLGGKFQTFCPNRDIFADQKVSKLFEQLFCSHENRTGVTGIENSKTRACLSKFVI